MISGLSTFPRNMGSALGQYGKTGKTITAQYALLDSTRQQLQSSGVTGILVV